MAKREQYNADRYNRSGRIRGSPQETRYVYWRRLAPKGLNHLIYEIMDNAVDEHLAGFCTRSQSAWGKDGFCTVT